jgi:hypothetical protein
MNRVVTQVRFWVAILVRNWAQSRVKIRASVWVRNRVRSYLTGKNSGKEAEQNKNTRDKETSLLWVRDLFVHRNIKFIQDRFNKEIMLNPSQIKMVNLS